MKRLQTATLVDILINPNTDYKTIALEVARRFPATFLKCSGEAGFKCRNLSDREDKVVEIARKIGQLSEVEKRIFPYINTDFITAIKEYRTATGLGLKESKEACEALRDAWKKQGIIR